MLGLVAMYYIWPGSIINASNFRRVRVNPFPVYSHGMGCRLFRIHGAESIISVNIYNRERVNRTSGMDSTVHR